MRKKGLNVMFQALLAFLLSAGVWFLASTATKHVFAQASATRVPLTLVKKELYYHYPTGELGPTLQSKLEIRSDGSRVEFKPRFPPPPNLDLPPTRVITDLQNRIRTVVDDVTQSKTTYQIGSSAAGLAQIPTDCGVPAGAPSTMFLGYPIVKAGKSIGSAAGEQPRSIESYRAPTLSCVEVRRLVYHQAQGGQSILTRVSEAVSIAVGDPDPQDFAIPSLYMERKPSDYFEQLHSRFPNVFPLIAPNTFAGQDQAYLENHR